MSPACCVCVMVGVTVTLSPLSRTILNHISAQIKKRPPLDWRRQFTGPRILNGFRHRVAAMSAHVATSRSRSSPASPCVPGPNLQIVKTDRTNVKRHSIFHHLHEIRQDSESRLLLRQQASDPIPMTTVISPFQCNRLFLQPRLAVESGPFMESNDPKSFF